MQDNWKEPSDLLGTFIKFLLLLLFLVLSYFFYKIVKADLSFSEVFNKKELLSAYKLFDNNDKEIYIEKEDYIEVLAKNIPTELEEQTQTAVLSAFKIREEPAVSKKEIETKKIEIVNTIIVEEIIAQEKVVVSEKPQEVQIIEEVKKEIVVESVTNKEASEETTLSKTYLDSITRELNSL
jgi:hypothetical protein